MPKLKLALDNDIHQKHGTYCPNAGVRELRLRLAVRHKSLSFIHRFSRHDMIGLGLTAAQEPVSSHCFILMSVMRSEVRRLGD